MKSFARGVRHVSFALWAIAACSPSLIPEARPEASCAHVNQDISINVGDSAIPLTLAAASGMREYRSESGKDGIARFRLISPGEYQLSIDQSYLDRSTEYLAAPIMTARVSAILGRSTSLDLRPTIKGGLQPTTIQVLAQEDGLPIPDVLVSGSFLEGHGVHEALQAAMTNDSGLVKLGHSEATELQLEFEHPLFERLVIRRSVGVASKIIVELSHRRIEPPAMELMPPGTVAGYVSDTSGFPITAATVILTGRGNAWADTAASDSTGFFRFSQIAPGDYTIRVRHIGFHSQQDSMVVDGRRRKPLPLQLRQLPVTVSSDSYFRRGTAGRVTDPESKPLDGAIVRYARSDATLSGDRLDVSDAMGHFSLSPVPAEYTHLLIECGTRTLLFKLSEVVDFHIVVIP